MSSATTRSRPIINTRDEPHADPERYRRLHVIVGDSNMSETTTLLKVGSAELVLRLIEAGVPMRDFTLENPIRAIRDMSRDRSGHVRSHCPTADEFRRSSYRPSTTRRCRSSSGESLGTRIVDRVLDLWERTLRAVAEDKLALIDTEIDWAIKLKLLDRYSPSTDWASPILGLPSSILRTTTFEGLAGCSHCSRSAAWLPASPRTRQSSAPRRSHLRPRGPSFEATSSVLRKRAVTTTPSTGCT